MIAQLLSAICLGVALGCFVLIMVSMVGGDILTAFKYLIVLLLFCFASWGFLGRWNSKSGK